MNTLNQLLNKVRSSHLAKMKPVLSIATVAKAGVLGLLAFAMVHSAYAGAPDPSTDLLTAAKTDITANIGPGSTFAWILYVVEIIGGVAAYMKTKNMLALVGVVVVMIFTIVAFSVIGTS